MAHYAFLDNDGLVVEVIPGRNENEVVDGISDWETYYAEIRGLSCKRTSYNTSGGVHLDGGVPFRKNFAHIGFTYDSVRDAFVPPRPYPSWQLNEDSCLWEPPVAYPDDTDRWVWDEDTTSWVQIDLGD